MVPVSATIWQDRRPAPCGSAAPLLLDHDELWPTEVVLPLMMIGVQLPARLRFFTAHFRLDRSSLNLLFDTADGVETANIIRPEVFGNQGIDGVSYRLSGIRGSDPICEIDTTRCTSAYFATPIAFYTHCKCRFCQAVSRPSSN
jgi:hypothetical protein